MQKSKVLKIIVVLVITVTVYGQKEENGNKWTINAGADLVSTYVCRGLYQSAVSVQPMLEVSVSGLSIGSWGSSDFSTIFKELDFYVSYKLKRLTVILWDYWWSGEGASYFKDNGSHFLEATLRYTFSEKFPLSLETNTMFTGDGDKDDNGKPLYSTYISANYPFSIKNVKNVDCEVGIGISPWKSMYSNKFNVATITAKASKSLRLSSDYTLPVFVELIFSPAQDNCFLIFGIKFL